MGRLIDVDEVKKRYPIMENDFGMVINEGLHKELDKIPTIEAIPLSVFDKIRAEIEHMACRQYEHKLTLDREEVLQIIGKYKVERSNKE